ncbi:hypothetical protein T484DRAFT_1830560 [Baffinella frigidus]|nr:hypothetical protein T484DRAFT_1830560 [Cryptophyta sp. CCMP2293]
MEALRFDNRALNALPIDPELCTDDQAAGPMALEPREAVPRSVFSLARPTPLLSPEVVAVKRAEFAEYFSGNRLLPGSRPAAHTYCGYQFGHFSGQLGDGATMYLGEVV